MSLFEMLDVAARTAAAQKPAPAWERDPTCRHESRYWNGEQWTPWVADSGVQTEDPVDLGQTEAEWRSRWANPTITALRAEVIAGHLGLTPSEYRAVDRWLSPPERRELADGDRSKVDQAIALLRTPRSQLTGWARNQQSVLLDDRNADLLDRGLAVALVHCRRCGGVVSLRYDETARRYRCPARHRFMLDDVSVVTPEAVEQATVDLAAGPSHKGVRL